MKLPGTIAALVLAALAVVVATSAKDFLAAAALPETAGSQTRGLYLQDPALTPSGASWGSVFSAAWR